MSDEHLCGTCGKPAATDDAFCGQCGGRLSSTAPSPPGPGGLRARLERLSFRRVSVTLIVVAASLVVLAWIDGERAISEFLLAAFVVLLALTVIGTLTLAWFRPIATGRAAALVGAVYAIPALGLLPDLVRGDLEEAQPVFLVAGLINLTLVALLSAWRNRTRRRSE